MWIPLEKHCLQDRLLICWWYCSLKQSWKHPSQPVHRGSFVRFKGFEMDFSEFCIGNMWKIRKVRLYSHWLWRFNNHGVKKHVTLPTQLRHTCLQIWTCDAFYARPKTGQRNASTSAMLDMTIPQYGYIILMAKMDKDGEFPNFPSSPNLPSPASAALSAALPTWAPAVVTPSAGSLVPVPSAAPASPAARRREVPGPATRQGLQGRPNWRWRWECHGCSGHLGIESQLVNQGLLTSGPI